MSSRSPSVAAAGRNDCDEQSTSEHAAVASTSALVSDDCSSLVIGDETGNDIEASTNNNKKKNIKSSSFSSQSSSTAPDLPKSNRDYGEKSYWENRFATESEFEWLVSYQDVSSYLERYINKKTKKNDESDRILVVGCGNSSFSSDLYDAGYENITNIDFSENVIHAMKDKNKELRPNMEWLVMDMTDMSLFPDASFDVVIDKAAMDAIMTQEGDVWNPEQSVIDSARSMCTHISRVLREGGYHLHISFAQPHFRKKYLLGLHPRGDGSVGVVDKEKEEDESGDEVSHAQKTLTADENYSKEFGWELKVETIGGSENDGCFHHFLYIMQKHS